jgi:hypothetical protein
MTWVARSADGLVVGTGRRRRSVSQRVVDAVATRRGRPGQELHDHYLVDADGSAVRRDFECWESAVKDEYFAGLYVVEGAELVEYRFEEAWAVRLDVERRVVIGGLVPLAADDADSHRAETAVHRHLAGRR